MRSVLRCAFQAFRSPRQRVATKQLLFGTRSAAKTATTTSKNLITTFCTPKLQHIARFSPIQRRFYSSETKPASEHLLKAAWEEVNKNPEKAIALFNQLLESAGTQTPFLYGKANALSNLGRFDEALELLDQLSAINPDEPVSGLKGAIHLKMENFELAVEHFEDANKRFPNELSILKPLAEAYIRAGRPFDALETLQQADEISPNDWDVINNLGICFRSLGPMYVTHALTLAQRAVELHPDAAHFWHNLAEIYMSIGEFDKSEECFDKMQMNDPNLALGSFNHAKLMLQMNKLDEAEKLLFKVVSLQIDDNSSFKPIDGDNLAFKANLTLFNLYIAQKRYGDAKALAEKLSKSEPFRTYGWYHLGWFTMTTNIDEAITYFEHALNIDSEDQYALDGLASCYFIKGQYDKAEEYFKRTSRFASAFASSRMYEQANAVIEFLLKKFPERASEIYNAQMGLNAFKKDYVAEFESLKKLLEASSDPIDCADLLLLNNDFEGALKVLDQLLDVDPNRLDAIIAKAIVLVENGHVKEALGWLNARRPENYDTGFAEVMTTTLSRDDDSLDKAEIFGQQFLSLFASQMAMSEVHRRRGNYEQALKSWRTSQKINQSSPDYIFPTSFPYRYLAHQQLGKILESMGDVEGAMKEYNIVLSINPLELFSKQRLEVLKSK